MKSITISAPAKVNLGLRIVGTTGDGRHALESLMLKINLEDRLRLRVEPGCDEISITGDGQDIALIPRASGNLVYDAWQLFQSEYGAIAVAADLEKRIPIRAGLGGGSSDAAAMLTALRTLTGKPASEDELLAIGARLGADVPFFLVAGHALAAGTGDVLHRVFVPRTWMVLLKPPRGVSTEKAYRLWDKHPVKQAGSPKEVVDALQNRNWGKLSKCLANDLAAVLLPERDDMREGIRALEEAGSVAVTVSGSGSTLVGVGKSQGHAFLVASLVSGRFPGWFNQVVETMGPEE